MPAPSVNNQIWNVHAPQDWDDIPVGLNLDGVDWQVNIPAQAVPAPPAAQEADEELPPTETLIFGDHHPSATRKPAYPRQAKEDDEVEMNITTTKLNKIIKYGPMSAIKGEAADLLQEFRDSFKKIIQLPLPTTARINKRSHETFVGIEIELEGHQLSLINPEVGNVAVAGFIGKAWRSEVDGSLRGEAREYITKGGTQAKSVPFILQLLKDYHHLYYNKIQTNFRCGTHVHVNVQDFTVEQLINFCFLYVLFEDTFYKMSGNRYKNIFCVPVRAGGMELTDLFKLLHNKKPTYQNFRTAGSPMSKYMGFNMLPIWRNSKGGPIDEATGKSLPLGTIEFRHHEGCNDPLRLTKWIQAILDLHYTAQNVDFGSLRDHVFSLNSRSTYKQMIEAVFTNPLPIKEKEIIEDMYEGSAYLKELYIVSKGQV